MTKDKQKQSLVFFTKFTFLNCLQIYIENLLIFNLWSTRLHSQVILFKIKLAKNSCNTRIIISFPIIIF